MEEARGLTMYGDVSMETNDGREINLLDPQPSAISIDSIANALSMQTRFNGHITRFYSVAEHSVLVSDLLLRGTGSYRLALAGLLHDASEAYMGDLISPVKHAMGGRHAKRWKDVERGLDTAICEALGLVPDKNIEMWHGPDVKAADWHALKIEASALTKSQARGWHWPDVVKDVSKYPPTDVTWTGGLDPMEAASLFLFRYEELRNPS